MTLFMSIVKYFYSIFVRFSTEYPGDRVRALFCSSFSCGHPDWGTVCLPVKKHGGDGGRGRGGGGEASSWTSIFTCSVLSHWTSTVAQVSQKKKYTTTFFFMFHLWLCCFFPIEGGGSGGWGGGRRGEASSRNNIFTCPVFVPLNKYGSVGLQNK